MSVQCPIGHRSLSFVGDCFRAWIWRGGGRRSHWICTSTSGWFCAQKRYSSWCQVAFACGSQSNRIRGSVPMTSYPIASRRGAAALFASVGLITSCQVAFGDFHVEAVGGSGSGDLEVSTSSGGLAALGGSSSLGGTSGTSTAPNLGGSEANGGASSMGGTISVGTAQSGGSVTTGGTPNVGGALATGGSRATGGVPAAGGTRAAGGTPSAGGGSVTTGGIAAAGGTRATGGLPSTGGSRATGGVAATGGTLATGGSKATGGVAATGGTLATGGNPSTGGSMATGGSSGSAACGAGAAPLNGLCWYLGAAGASCSDTCANHGGLSSLAVSYVGTALQGGSLSKCTAVLN